MHHVEGPIAYSVAPAAGFVKATGLVPIRVDRRSGYASPRMRSRSRAARS